MEYAKSKKERERERQAVYVCMYVCMYVRSSTLLCMSGSFTRELSLYCSLSLYSRYAAHSTAHVLVMCVRQERPDVPALGEQGACIDVSHDKLCCAHASRAEDKSRLREVASTLLL